VHIKRLLAVLGLAVIALGVLPRKVTAAHDQRAVPAASLGEAVS
jgi:hypothetical protein